jgi:hypothetical protein
MAAKAAEIEIVGIASRHIAQGVSEDDLLIANDRGGDSVWNPLADDGDALRLAVKLKMDAFVHTSGFTEAVCPMGSVVREPHGSDPQAATRRAIVRAAAEIGRSM